MEIESNNILLRNFRKKDLNDVFLYSSQRGIGEGAGWKHHQNKEEAKKLLNTYCANENIFAIVYKSNGKVIGHIAINKDSTDNKEDIKELGFALNRDYQRQGIMTETISLVLEELFSKKINKVYACCFQENIISKLLIEKCGFILEQEGIFHSEELRKTFNTFEYIYTKEMWENKS